MVGRCEISSLTPVYHVFLRQENEKTWGRGTEASERKLMQSWSHSCYRPILRTFKGPHPFFNHQQTPVRFNTAYQHICSNKFQLIQKKHAVLCTIWKCS